MSSHKSRCQTSCHDGPWDSHADRVRRLKANIFSRGHGQHSGRIIQRPAQAVQHGWGRLIAVQLFQAPSRGRLRLLKERQEHAGIEM